jgi:hypothetical protein
MISTSTIARRPSCPSAEAKRRVVNRWRIADSRWPPKRFVLRLMNYLLTLCQAQSCKWEKIALGMRHTRPI